MSDIGSTFPVPSVRTGTFPRAGGGRLGGGDWDYSGA